MYNTILMEQFNNTDLLTFINNEKKENINYNFHNIYNFFFKCFIKTIVEVNNKIKDIDNIQIHVITGSNVMFHVFCVLLNYSNNLTLTIFLSERAVLLYTEFIIMSKNPNINKDLCYIPNLVDAMNFAFKKTIGPLKINNNTKFKNNSIFILKLIIQNIYKQNNNLDNINEYLQTINISLIKINKLLNNEDIFYEFFQKITNLLNQEPVTNIKYIIFKIKILIELIYEIKNKKQEYIIEKIKKYGKIIENYNLTNIIKNYKKHQLYITLKTIE